MSSKQRRARGENRDTWRQNQVRDYLYKMDGKQPEWEKRRELREYVKSEVFDKLELEEKAYGELIEHGNDSQSLFETFQSVGKILQVWYALTELPKQARKPLGILNDALAEYLSLRDSLLTEDKATAYEFARYLSPYNFKHLPEADWDIGHWNQAIEYLKLGREWLWRSWCDFYTLDNTRPKVYSQRANAPITIKEDMKDYS